MYYKCASYAKARTRMVLVMNCLFIGLLLAASSGCDLGTYGRRFQEQEKVFQQQDSGGTNTDSASTEQAN